MPQDAYGETYLGFCKRTGRLRKGPRLEGKALNLISSQYYSSKARTKNQITTRKYTYDNLLLAMAGF